MSLTKFLLPPNQASYSVTDGQESVSTKLDGGAARYRKDILDATSAVKGTWLLTPAKFEYFRAFYKTVTRSASLPFLIDLILDEADNLVEHTAYFVPGTMKISGVAGLSYSIEADMEVVPIPADHDYNLILIAAYEEYGEDRAGFLAMINQLEQLANYDLDVS